MSREILFKARQCGTGLWLFGNVAGYTEHGDGRICFLNETMSNGQIITRHCDPETVCQYTGLRDADGEMIFEGDMYNTKRRPKPRTVFYSEDEAKFKVHHGKLIDFDTAEYEFEHDMHCKDDIAHFRIKVIGSIHDPK